MRNKITAVLIAGFFLTLVVSALNINIHRPNILVLHSYDTSYIWTRDLNAGLKRGLDGQSWIQTRYHYMNTKKKSDPGHLRRASIAARKAIDDGKPDVIIAFDDYAQQLAGSYYVNHPDIKIVFAAVNGGVETYNYIGADNVTGIYERKPVAAIKETITLLSKAIGKDIDGGDQVRIALLGDTTLSAKRDEDYVGSYQWAPLVYTGAFTIADFEQWKTTVFGLATKVDFIMVGGYRKLKRLPDSGPKEEFVPPGEVMRWTEKNSPVPVIGINIFNTEDGAMMSVGVSPFEQGNTAANMARRILEDGVAPSKIPFATSQQYVVAFRRSALDRRKLQIPKIFEAFARATDNYHD